jgi:hypothetical protein
MEMRDAAFGGIPVYLVFSNSDAAIAILATPDDVRDVEWSQVLEIVCRVIQRRNGSGKPYSRELACAAINTAITSTDITDEQPGSRAIDPSLPCRSHILGLDCHRLKLEGCYHCLKNLTFHASFATQGSSVVCRSLKLPSKSVSVMLAFTSGRMIAFVHEMQT